MQTVSVAVIPGDGIGIETVQAARRLLDRLAELDGGIKFAYTEFPWGCAYYTQHGEMAPKDFLSTLRSFETIMLGAVGYPGVPDHVSLWGLLLPIRRGFEQYVNMRPVRILRGVTSPLRGRNPGDVNFVVIRENTEGEYSSMGGRLHTGFPHEVVVQNTVFTRLGTERVIRYAYRLAAKAPRKRLCGATKSNGINWAMPFWDEVFNQIGETEFPEVERWLTHIDALAANFVLKPDVYDVVVASNLFGDILTDLGGAVMGSIGMAPSANINPERKYPSMFEPVHGSAPDIAGKGIANPVGQIWSSSMMLDHLGRQDLGEAVMTAVEDVLEEGRVRTPDLGGRSTTNEMVDAIIARLEARFR
ncbi:tartrate dehydrogenase/decarboxylase/D-malate dehydrogenase [Symbiobacterium terraclitae]|uniref:D-malate dehydrogenase (decarboxylating) n=1 Tax=Symbiobacterium terraclitae TaxID=557451 RepID=A0ABS4JT66_9FIRM|nr:tartrate dehydrogenase [Symbiobacterium terraclitae]MBP2018725.1 tartrate dehydrogenase/decarboxylase/D-malate dehydrogenase [Symbiobacterium terraclitae]